VAFAAELSESIHRDASAYGFSHSLAGATAADVAEPFRPRLDWPLLKRRRDAYIERLHGIYA
jgi:hypothetical protein